MQKRKTISACTNYSTKWCSKVFLTFRITCRRMSIARIVKSWIKHTKTLQNWEECQTRIQSVSFILWLRWKCNGQPIFTQTCAIKSSNQRLLYTLLKGHAYYQVRQALQYSSVVVAVHYYKSTTESVAALLVYDKMRPHRRPTALANCDRTHANQRRRLNKS